MVRISLLCACITVQIVLAYTQSGDVYYLDNKMVIGNLKRREVIPLNPYSRNNGRRRYGNDAQGNLNYRRTKEIREDFVDRRFELSESQLRESKLDNKEHNLDKLHNELNWLSLGSEEEMGILANIIQKQ
ncbi:hypothetical protein HW555_012995 [Spodoptera exigua]|uniref:Uncharacterized protein n=1 Tax=Spodoptera exigua TaxID=7107 RepID=A0A835L073_SPOEX|nr:hypothetical protein HW555_012995 [Spodoptera exigua]KAH9633958.1 hypothetical protein HF086_015162 [Spodoptera exigua]